MLAISPFVLIAPGALVVAKPLENGHGEATLTVGNPITAISFHYFPKPTHGPHPVSLLHTSTSTRAVTSTIDSVTGAVPSAVEGRDETSSGQGLTPYQTMVLNSHNVHRQNHTAQNLRWGDWLAAAAKVLSDGCIFKDDTSINKGGYGQNVGAGTHPDHIDELITNTFYNGEFASYVPYFGESHPDMSNFDQWGHLTQLLWNDTSEVACYTSFCSTIINGQTGKPFQGISPWLSVCNYATLGNIDGMYDHVHKPLGHPAVTVP